MSLEIQKFLRADGLDEHGLSELRIKHKRHVDYQNLVLFKYDLFADFSLPIVQECRGIILDEKNDWSVVGRAFDKFFNLGEPHAATIDWPSAVVQEKLDGSLCMLYYYAGEWHVATTGTPDASGNVHGSGRTFAKYFWDTWEFEDGILPPPAFKDVCFLFELTGPDNRIVVVHAEPGLTLLAARHRVTGQWLDLQDRRDVPWMNFCLARHFKQSSSFADLQESFDTISPLVQEGYVVSDARGNRVKVKHPKYVELHHMKNGLTDLALLRVVQSGEEAELLSSFPEFATKVNAMRDRFLNLCYLVEMSYVQLLTPFGEVLSQKEFAARAKATDWPHLMFSMRKHDEQSIDSLRRVSVDKLQEILDRVA